MLEEQACVSVSEGYVKAISGLFNLSERELAHFHNDHLSFPDPPHCFPAEPPVQNSETSPVRPPPSPLWSFSPDLSPQCPSSLIARPHEGG